MYKYLLFFILIFPSISYADLNKIYPVTLESTIENLPEELSGQWKEQGFCLIDGIFSPAQVQKARAEILVANGSLRVIDFGGVQFPKGPRELADIALDERLLGIARQLLGTDRVELTQADAWIKTGAKRPNKGYAVFESYDQRLHMDFPNHTMLHPPTWYKPEVVSMIVYLDDHEKTGGMTAVRPRLGANDPAYKYPYTDMPGLVDWPYINDRTIAEAYIKKYSATTAKFREKIYSELKYAAFNPGTVLIYRHDIWHRGTPLIDGAERLVINLVYKKPGLPWVHHWASGYAGYLYDWYVDPTNQPPKAAVFAQLIPQLSLQQLAALGFPLPGDATVNPEMLRAIKARYPQFDISRY